jgi:phosphotriesterase-related protein
LHAKNDYPPDALTKSADQIADDLVAQAKRERWGAIGEMGTGTAVPMDPMEQKGFEAAAKAHLRAGLPIITHVSGGCAQCALDQVDLLERSGVDLQHVVIGHLNDIRDNPSAAPIAIAKRGAYLGFDHSGKPDDPRADEYARTILAVLDAGFEQRVCLSSDFNDPKYLRKNGGPGIDFMRRDSSAARAASGSSSAWTPCAVHCCRLSSASPCSRTLTRRRRTRAGSCAAWRAMSGTSRAPRGPYSKPRSPRSDAPPPRAPR